MKERERCYSLSLSGTPHETNLSSTLLYIHWNTHSIDRALLHSKVVGRYEAAATYLIYTLQRYDVADYDVVYAISVNRHMHETATIDLGGSYNAV
jgi:hypothetical protein